MHDIRFIRDNPDAFDHALKRRGLAPQAQRLIALDERRRHSIKRLEEAQARRNAVSREIGEAKKRRDEATSQRLMGEIAELKNVIPGVEVLQNKFADELADALAEIPNLPLDEVPDGKDEKDNVEHHRFGAKREYAFAPKQHFDLGEALGQMDFETAAKLSGARFVVLKKGVARLERALGQFMLDVHTGDPHNYIEIAPPLLVRDDSMFGTAQLPKFKEDQFAVLSIDWEAVSRASKERTPETLKRLRQKYEEHRVFEFDDDNLSSEARLTQVMAKTQPLYEETLRESGDELRRDVEQGMFTERRWLIPTAEVPLTNLVRESIVDEAQLPMRFTACTPCFRAEAGAAGKDTRGMIRQHQFTKVELVSITAPEQSKDEHERMLACAEEVLRRLDLHYRVMTLCAGDMGFASQKTYDIEVWLPGQSMISSCSICGEFQARRMNARYRTKEGRAVRHVHTLNGSGVAVGRALIAVMETYQQADGSIAVPEVLQGYMGGMKKIEK
jgi:seryl-tRNA synthetase